MSSKFKTIATKGGTLPPIKKTQTNKNYNDGTTLPPKKESKTSTGKK